MAVTVRIDDRLIHGQVVIAWCPVLKPDRLILCHEQVARTAWEVEVFKEAALEYPLDVCDVEQTANILREAKAQEENVFLIVDSPRLVVELLDRGVKIDKVNVGGMHDQPGKRQVTPFLYVDDEDIHYFRILKERNVRLEGREVPAAPAIDVAECLGL